MDIAVNLVESYLRLNGYLTLSEFEIQQRTRHGQWETVTDVDVVGVRFPGDIYLSDTHDAEECRLLLVDDPGLHLEPETVDVVIGEVKQGEAVFNPGLTSHTVLHTVLRRLGWLYEDLGPVVRGLQQDGMHRGPARAGGTIRSRLVAFGRSGDPTVHAVSLAHIVETLMRHFSDFDEILRGAQFKEPAPALLHLLSKAGFGVSR